MNRLLICFTRKCEGGTTLVSHLSKLDKEKVEFSHRNIQIDINGFHFTLHCYKNGTPPECVLDSQPDTKILEFYAHFDYRKQFIHAYYVYEAGTIMGIPDEVKVVLL